MTVIDLRSDTVTLPTDGMLDAMRAAPLGDDVFGEDPTVNRLEEMAARLLGKEAALLVVSGTMGNLLAIMAHASRGEEALVDPEAHIAYYEAGGMASVAGVMPRPLPCRNGILDPDDLAAAIRPRNLHFPVPKVLCLENTHNRAGGRVTPPDVHDRLCRIAHANALAVHLDGARIFNAAIAAGVRASTYAAEADSVMFCLSKGLACPVGSVLVGSESFIATARRCRKVIGGGMRQAGVIAAAGLVALDTMIERLAEDHANARRLATGLNDIPRFRVDMDRVETNMFNARVEGVTAAEALDRMRQKGVLALARSAESIRFVTNRHHSREVVEEALGRIRDVIGPR